MTMYAEAQQAWTDLLTEQYAQLKQTLTQQYELAAFNTEGIPPPTKHDWQILDAKWQFLADVAGVDYALGLTPSGKRRRKALTKTTLARRQIAKGNAKHKMRKHPMKRGYRMYRWTAYGSADDYLCSRYVNQTFSAAYTLPEPGDSMNMNDSHINCQCILEYIGMAGADGRPANMQDQYERYLLDPDAHQGVAP